MNKPTSLTRLSSLDILRGLIMVLMTLDHTRDFFSNTHFNPTDLDKTTPALFLTRWITHFCAPVFVFLAGTSACLWQTQRGPDAAISRFLMERGALLIVLVFTVEAWAWNFRYNFTHLDAGVLWALGWSMICLAGLIKLPLRWVVCIGGVMVIGHNAFDSLKPADLGVFGPWWSVLHTGDDINLSNNLVLSPYYPLIPWIGVMALGYGFGKCISSMAWHNRRQLFLKLGFIMMVMFIVLRFSNLYGDPKPWQIYVDPQFTLLSFINCHKYPPSLLYLLMTLGPALVILGLVEDQSKNRWAILQSFGRTPLFFYLLHLYLIHSLALLLAVVNDGPVSALLGEGIWSPGLPADYGYELPTVYLLWLFILLLMYPLCCGFEKLKLLKPHWGWLKYL